VLDIWCHEDAPSGSDDRDIETVEAEVVFLARQAGQWPEGQTEIHFHPSTEEHRAVAASIWKTVTGESKWVFKKNSTEHNGWARNSKNWLCGAVSVQLTSVMSILIGYWALVFDFHKAILLSIRSGFYGSAFALVRPVVEALVRSHVAVLGSDDDVKQLRRDEYRVNFATIGPWIDQEFRLGTFFTNFLTKARDALHSFTHSGLSQVTRRFDGHDLTPRYKDIEIIEVIKSTPWLGVREPAYPGKTPYWPDILLSRVVRPAVARAGIQKHVGWHTFRHSFSTMLIANGENVKVVQELMRHSNCRCTLESIPKLDFRQSATPSIGLLRWLFLRSGRLR
jgi:hypothetical protein